MREGLIGMPFLDVDDARSRHADRTFNVESGTDLPNHAAVDGDLESVIFEIEGAIEVPLVRDGRDPPDKTQRLAMKIRPDVKAVFGSKIAALEIV